MKRTATGNNLQLCAVKVWGLHRPRFQVSNYSCVTTGLEFWRVRPLLKFINFTVNSAVDWLLRGEIEGVNFEF
jgi:hypothetical protein